MNVVVYDFQYMDMVIYDIRYLNVVVCDIWYMNVIDACFIMYEHAIIFGYNREQL